MAPRKYPIRETAFSRLTNETVYWIGLLRADGNVRADGCVRLVLRNEDSYQLRRFLAFVGCAKRPLTQNGPTCSVACINSRRIAGDLLRLGILPRKSYKNTYVPKRLLHRPSFWLGYLDGNGDISWASSKSGGRKAIAVRLAGPHRLIQQAARAFAFGERPLSVTPTKSSYCWITRRTGAKAKRLIRWLYSRSVPYLHRKRLLAQRALSWRRIANDLRSARITKHCQMCGKPITRTKAKWLRTRFVLCSRKCWYSLRRRDHISTKPPKHSSLTVLSEDATTLVTRRHRTNGLGE